MLFFETWYQDISKYTDPLVKLDRYERLLKYGLYGEKDLDGLSPEATIMMERMFAQINDNKTRHQENIEQGKTGGRTPGYDHSPVKQLLMENRGNAAEVARQMGIKANTLRASKEYLEWRDRDGKPWYENGVLVYHGEKVKNSFSPQGEKSENDFSRPLKTKTGEWNF